MRNDKNSHSVVHQSDLEELILLGHELSRAREEWEQKRDFIRAALARGAGVEPGVHEARLVSVEPRASSSQPKPYLKLIVR